MAEVAVARGHHHRHTASISAMDNGIMLRSAPRIEMLPNPEFSFPALSQTSRTPALQPPASEVKRPVSMHSNAPPATQPSLSHRRNHTALPSSLPSFSFNATDTSGRSDSTTPPLTPEIDEALPVTPKRGHRREGSQLVGGDIRLGAESLISSSPIKSSMLAPNEQPAGRHGHGHRRSGATSISSVANVPILPPTEDVESRVSSSLPSTPPDHPSQPTRSPMAPSLDRSQSAPNAIAEARDVFGGPLEPDTARPASRSGPGVTFCEKVEIIPRSRPLSTVSSETESSMSTVRGHNTHGSLISLLSLGASTPSPQTNRNTRSMLSTALEDESHSRSRSSIEISKRIEKEGEWLKSSRSSQSLKRSSAEISTDASAPVTLSSLSFAEPQAPVRQRQHQKKHSFLAGRRRSLPAILAASESQAHSLQSMSQDNLQNLQNSHERGSAPPVQRRSSTKKLREWATSKISRRSRDFKTLSADAEQYLARPRSAGNEPVPGKVPMPEPACPTAETNLDAVFSSQSPGDKMRTMSAPSQPKFEVSTPTPSYVSSFHSQSMDDTSAVLDLDDALGPFNSHALSSLKPRRELHSNRLNRDFSGPGLHYHRRAESAPELPPFSRGSMVSHSSLPDVFENDGEEEAEASQAARPTTSGSQQDEEGGIGIQIVDADITGAGPGFAWAVDDGLRIQSGEWEPERPSTSYGNVSSRLSTPSNERRPSSIIDQTIIEESSPVEAVQIVESHEEPRASSLTKSSDSSETPTILALKVETLAVPDGAQSLMTPETYQTSTFSSPDFSRRQGSFDTSRVGTAASSMTDNRTMSSCTGEHSHGVRTSVDDVPSLTSSRSTMMSTMHANTSRRDFGSTDRVPSVGTMPVDPVIAAERRRKRASIQSLSQLMGGSFSSKLKDGDESRPQTAVDPVMARAPKKEHGLKKLMFWRSKSRQSLKSAT